MTARFEVVRTDAGWHARFRAANGRIVWTTEQYARRAGAWEAIRLLVANAEKAVALGRGVVEVDERIPPPLPPVARPPFYHKTTRPILDMGTRRARLGPSEDWWHDSEMHSRNCYDEDCTEAMPPKGAKVHVRGGVVTYDERADRG